MVIWVKAYSDSVGLARIVSCKSLSDGGKWRVTASGFFAYSGHVVIGKVVETGGGGPDNGPQDCQSEWDSSHTVLSEVQPSGSLSWTIRNDPRNSQRFASGW